MTWFGRLQHKPHNALQAPGLVELPLENPRGARHPRIHLNMMASEEDKRAVRVSKRFGVGLFCLLLG